ncbi:MAG: phosphotyrosine protein phosphatase [Rhizorhabdus sp.]
MQQLKDGYGGKRGFALNLLAVAETLLPRFRPMRRIDWARVERLVFICKGNICRSAYAQGRAAQAGLVAVSAGLDTQSGLPASQTAIDMGEARGLDLKPHRTRRLDELDLGPGDLMICMEPPQARAALAHFPAAQVTLLGLWSRPRRPWLFDPYGLDTAYWRTCLDLIDSGVAAITARIRQARR